MRRAHRFLRETFAFVGVYVLLNGVAAVPLAHAILFDAQTALASPAKRRETAPSLPDLAPFDLTEGAFGPEELRDTELRPSALQVGFGPSPAPSVTLVFASPVAQLGEGSRSASMPQGP